MSYSLQDGNNREWGIGTIAAGNVLNRTTITGTLVAGTYTTGGAALTLSGGTSLLECVEHEGSALDTIDNADALRLKVADVYSDFVAFGFVTGTSASLSGVMTPGVAYLLGTRVEKLIADATLTFTYVASQDTYNDISNAGVITHVAVANGAAAPVVTANSIRLEKVVTSGTAITSVVRLASGRSLPVAVKDPVTGTTVLMAGGVAIPTPGNLATNGFAALGVVVTGGVPGTSLVDSTGATPPVIQAQWVPRTGTYSDLSTTTLNPGEIATATDTGTIFVNNRATAGLGTPYNQKTSWSMRAGASSTPTITAANTDILIPLSLDTGTAGMIDGSGYILPVNNSTFIEVRGYVVFDYDAARTSMLVTLQAETALNSGLWFLLDGVKVAQSTVTSPLKTKVPIVFAASRVATGTGRIRLVGQSDSASGALSLGGYVGGGATDIYIRQSLE
jgi:hypothetical protein